MSVQLILARNNLGTLVHIDDVPSGLACECYCPDCGARLEARKGPVNRHHFSHDQRDAKFQNCSYGPETELHLALKRLLQQKMKAIIPTAYSSNKTVVINLDSSQLETCYPSSAYRCDVETVFRGEPIYFEIKVTHATGKDKLDFIKVNNFNVVEVSTPSDANINNETLEEIFQRSEFKWLSLDIFSAIGQSVFANEKSLQQSFIDENKRLEKIIEDQKWQIAGNDRRLSQQAPSIESVEKNEHDLTVKERGLRRQVARLMSQKREIQNQIQQKNDELDFLLQRGFEITEAEKQKTESNYLKSLAAKHSQTIEKNEKVMALLCEEIDALRSKKAELVVTVKSKQLEVSALDNKEEELIAYESKLQQLEEEIRRKTVAVNKAIRILKDLETNLKPTLSNIGTPWPISNSVYEEIVIEV
ncbi:competence protein CoiA family protein [Pseudoalteromonas spongiae]|uniref:competence protein CoiA family protein n=1 Tax=Pseudoalteromonas spongiae TaxID=298657 RepID=UPI000C2D10D0|nr:competence protein CoiA family protein [Pseudoalteromonas spongiae]